MELHTKLMLRAIEVAQQGIADKQSPFGAVIANRQGDIIAAEHNRVGQQCDATAHAEITAIREACRLLGTIDLSGHFMVTTCEPCPMCAAAIHWSRLYEVAYGATIEDAKQAHFNELSLSAKDLYQQSNSLVRIVPFVMREECRALFELWKKGPNPSPY